MKAKKATRLVELAAEMRRLSAEMEELLLADTGAEPTRKNEVPSETESVHSDQGSVKASKGVTVGDVVRVCVRDKYHGRIGRVTGKRGGMFWWIQLEATPYEATEKIYKMRTSFRKVTK